MEKLILAVLMVASMVGFGLPLYRRLQIVGAGAGTLSVDPLGPRVGRFLSEVVFQTKIIRERPFAGFMHALVFWGFMAFALETLDHFAHGFGFSILGSGAFHDGFSAVLSVFAVGVLVGIVALAVRRFVFRPPGLGKKFSLESGVVAIFIIVLMVTYLLPEWGQIPAGTTAAKVNWWIHAGIILAFPPLIVTSKHLHLVLSPVTTFLKAFRYQPLRKLDFENEEFGAEKLADLHQHSLLGAFTCVECGRCQDHCPAFNTGKVLNPKQIMLDIEEGALKDVNAEAVASGAVSEEMLWQCTTCGACTDQCPVGIDQVAPIVDLRRGLVANGSFPDTFTTFFKNLETAGNPWAYSPHTGSEFIEEAKYPAYEGEKEVLYWMGCLARYDDAYRKVSKDFAKVLDASGVSWGVIESETCTGDAARRAGNEFLFSMLAEQNVETFNEAKPKKIVATCPHCVRTIEEYKEFGLDPNIEVVHHSTLIEELIDQGKLPMKESDGDGALVYHDPCYMSRYKKDERGVESPRAILARTGKPLVEAERSGTRSFCCGAGGAMVFREETEGKRINHERVDELIGTGAKTVGVGCPFCRMMVKDGMTDRGQEDVEVKDLAQLVAERLDG